MGGKATTALILWKGEGAVAPGQQPDRRFSDRWEEVVDAATGEYSDLRSGPFRPHFFGVSIEEKRGGDGRDETILIEVGKREPQMKTALFRDPSQQQTLEERPRSQ